MTRFLEEPDVARFSALFGTTVVKATVDDVLRHVRSDATRESVPVPAYDDLLGAVRMRLARVETDGLVPVLNGTGIVLHTNLGRAPLGDDALDAMREVASGYSNLEFDLETGARGSRYARVRDLFRATTGAEDSLVVNNCAAAVLLILDTFAKDREVIVSRNQLVEIGGGFRLPDVLARSGARLVEVGATNKVYARDFERALTVDTALFVRSHPSNYRIEGFTADVSASELAALGKRAGVPTVEDQGSGALVDLAEFGLPHERTVREAVADGMDLVAFSGDKLLGGPQVGAIVGRTSAIARLRANPLLRALRVDKATLAALAATLRCYVEPRGHLRLPLYAMLSAPVARLRERAERIVASARAALGESDRIDLAIVASQAFAGGGAAPLDPMPSIAISIRANGTDAGAIVAALRGSEPRVVARASDGIALIDLRAIPESRDDDVVRALARALA